MAFQSILFAGSDPVINEKSIAAPDFFADLNLDQIINAVTSGRQEYNLKPFFYSALSDGDTIAYRQEVMRDLECKYLFDSIQAFTHAMRTVRHYRDLIATLRHKHHKEGWFLETVDIYCETVKRLRNDMNNADLKSRGFLALREYIMSYTSSERFIELDTATKKQKDALSSISYNLILKGSTVRVLQYDAEIDYSAEVERIFARFKQGSVKDYLVSMPTLPDMNHIEEKILDRVARLYPEIFSDLDRYCEQNADYLDDTIRIFEREIQFYIAYLEYIAPLQRAGLKFCYPVVSACSKEEDNREGFDLALAEKLLRENAMVVCNDFHLKGEERVFIVSGPNQGGKTTFARSFGQLHYLAALGCPVPGSQARLFLSDRLFTHFEKEEDITNQSGKLKDDLIRIHEILDQATSNSIIIMNEIFTSTTLKDAVFLSRKIMERIMHLDVLCVCVTFIDELAHFSEKTVSMVSTVAPENPERRTYKILRKPPDGLSYALTIAEKYGLTYERLKGRLTP